MTSEHIPPSDHEDVPVTGTPESTTSAQPGSEPAVAAHTDDVATTSASQARQIGGMSLSTVAFLVIAVLATIAIIINVARKNNTAAPVTSSIATPPAAAATAPPVPTPVITGGSTAAVVNGHSVPMADFRILFGLTLSQNPGGSPTVTKSLVTQTINQLAYFELIRQYGATHGITVSQAEIDKRIKQDEVRAGGAAAFATRLKAVSLTVHTYAHFLGPTIMAQKISNQLFPLHRTPAPVAHVRHILITLSPTGKPARTDAQAHALANQILNQLKSGANFATLARKYSDDTGSVPQGGDLGTFSPHQMVPAFDRASFTLPPHTFAIVHSQFGYHILEVLSRGKALPSLATAQKSQQAQFDTWLAARLKKAKIVTLAKVH